MKRTLAHLTGSLQVSISALQRSAGISKSTMRRAGGKSQYIGIGGNDMLTTRNGKVILSEYDYTIKNCLHPHHKNCMHCDNFSICPTNVKDRTIKESIDIYEQENAGADNGTDNK